MKTIICLLLTAYLICMCKSDLATESSAYAVEIIFYRATVSEWNSKSLEPTFGSIIASGADSYCSSNPSECGLYSYSSSTNAFKVGNIGKVTGFPQNDEKNLKHKIYIEYPSGSDVSNSSATQYVLLNTVVYEIIRSIRETMHTSTGYWITWADETYYGIPVTVLENQIIIPIACAVLLGVIILAIVLNVMQKRRLEAERLQKKIEDRKANKTKRAMVQPTYRVPQEEPVTNNELDTKTKLRKTENDSKEKLYDNEYPRKTKANRGGATNTDSAVKMDDNRDVQNGDYVYPDSAGYHTLQPTQREDDVDGEKKKKKKKKEKKKKSRRSELEGHVNPADSYDLTTEL